MNLSGVNLGQTMAPSAKAPVVVQEGQVVHGTITKLYPDQKAEVTINGQKMVAQLETPMRAGDSHFFQVTSAEPNMKMKIVSGPVDSKTPITEQAKQLMETMKLPQTKDMQQLVTHFLKNDLPISKDQLIAAEQLLKNVSGGATAKNEAIVALQKMIELKLPMTDSTLNAVIQGGAKSGFIDQLGRFESTILTDPKLSPAVKQAVLDQLTNLKMPLNEQLGSASTGKMIESLLQNKGSSESLQAMVAQLKDGLSLPASTNRFNLAQTLFNQLPANPNDQIRALVSAQPQTAQNLAQLSAAIKEHPTLSQEQVKSIEQAITRFQLSPTAEHRTQLVEEVGKQLQATKPSVAQLMAQLKGASPENRQAIVQQMAKTIADDPSLTLQQKQSIILSLSQIGTKGVSQAFKTILSAYSEQASQFSTDASKNVAELLGLSKGTFSQVALKMTQNPSPIVQQLVQNMEQSLQQNLTGKDVHAAIKQTLQDLGLNLEAKLLEKGQDVTQLKDTLKAQLQSLLDDQPSNATRHGAEQIIARLNGQQLLSSENGPQQQIIMQIPLQMFGKKTDATIQWTGSKNKDGKIDANFARIMFYLQLDSLEETVIDMQVQSRVVTLNVYTEKNDVSPLINPLKTALKEGLEKNDYHLSGVFLKNFVSQQQPVKQQQKSGDFTSEKGMDFRI